MKTLREYFESVEQINSILEDVATANPYTNPDQAEIYDKLTPQDQQWATQGGGQPDLTDPYILARMPNKGKQVAQPAPAAPAAEPTAQAAQPAKATWPTTRDEIIAFQAAHKDAQGNSLAKDGLIGQRTMAALQAAGATPPEGFKPVANKAGTAPAAATSGQAARPKTSGATSPDQSAYQAMIAAKEKLDAVKGQDAWYLPTSAATQSSIDQAQKDYTTAQQAYYKALDSKKAATDPKALAKQQQIKALQSQLAAAKTPQEKQGIQAALNSLQQMSESVSYNEEQTLARIVDLARR